MTYGLFIACFLFPPLFFKKFFFIFLAFLFALISLCKRFVNVEIYNPFFLVVIFLLYALYGSLVGVDGDLSVQFLFSIIFLFSYQVFRRFNIDVDRIFEFVAYILVFFIFYISSAYFDILILPYSELMINFFIQNDLGFIGFRRFDSVSFPMLHFISTPVLMVAMSIVLINNLGRLNLSICFKVFLFVFAIFLSGSRGVLLFSLFNLAVILFFYSGFRYRVILSLLAGLVVFYLGSSYDFGTAFSLSEKSNSVKVDHVVSFLNYVDATTLLFGDGLASFYYTDGFGRFAAQTEIMILDFIRYFGVLTSLVVICLFIFPVYLINGKFKVKKVQRYQIPLFFTFINFLLMSFTNPMLLNSFGMLIVVWYWLSMQQTQRVSQWIHQRETADVSAVLESSDE
jgi:hypothetical protein